MSYRACLAFAAAIVLASMAGPDAVWGQGSGAPPTTPRQGALIDLTGQWVSVITEDWRWRMVTPPKGDTASVPLNPAGRKIADAWNLDADRKRGELCKAFGPPALIRQPGRIRIRWDGGAALLLEFDAGTQTRRLNFGSARTQAGPTRQGQSAARWFRQPQNRGIFGRGNAATGGSLEVVTTNLSPGYLRPNGVPYSGRTVVVVDRDDCDRRSRLPHAGVRAQLAVQKGDGPVEMESASLRHSRAGRPSAGTRVMSR